MFITLQNNHESNCHFTLLIFKYSMLHKAKINSYLGGKKYDKIFFS